MFTLLSFLLCLLTSHSFQSKWEGKRMFLKCESCGHETPGIKVGASKAEVALSSKVKVGK